MYTVNELLVFVEPKGKATFSSFLSLRSSSSWVVGSAASCQKKLYTLLTQLHVIWQRKHEKNSVTTHDSSVYIQLCPGAKIPCALRRKGSLVGIP